MLISQAGIRAEHSHFSPICLYPMFSQRKENVLKVLKDLPCLSVLLKSFERFTMSVSVTQKF